MKAKHPILIILAVFFVILSFRPSPVRALEDIPTYVTRANDAYSQGDYKGAIELYKSALDQGADNPYLYYNMGNTFYRLGLVGQAIASYRLALRQAPRDADIMANLKLARKQVKDKIEDPVSGLTLNRLLAPASYLSRFELKVITLISYALFWALIALSAYKKNLVIQTTLVISLLIGSYGGILIFASKDSRTGEPVWSLSYKNGTPSSGVIITPTANIHSGDSKTYQVTFILHDGVEIELGERRDNWIQVILPDGRQGWTPVENVATL